jgi:peptide deformylase
MMLPLSIYGDPVLRKHGEEIAEITPELVQLAQDMLETMDANYGCGLAAHQVGRPIRMFVIRNYKVTPEGRIEYTNPQVYINPKLSNHTKATQTNVEGCLSIPGVRVSVERPLGVVVEATNLAGERFTEDLTHDAYKAQMILHENDHINGILMVDRTDTKTRNKIEPALRSLKKKRK